MNVQRIGMLVCDEVAAPLIARHGQYVDMFARLLASTGLEIELHAYRVYADEFPPSVDSYDAYIVSGSHA